VVSFNTSGIVFNIQRFSLHDGPGIRSTVFMKGCPLKCLWCANPESQDLSPNLMVRDITCKACGACVDVCLRDAIRINRTGDRIIDWDLCDQCLSCVKACIYNCLSICGERMSVADVMDEVMRDEAFYKNSEGGVTISGGEPLLQVDFTVHLLSELKAKGLHTAVDTCGQAPWSEIEKILPVTDLLLWDTKHLDNPKHKWATGVGNELILSNLERAAGQKSLWLRLPLIAGVNDSEEHIRRVAALGRRLKVEKISLLPYHEGGKTKCDQIGKPYQLLRAAAPSDEHIETLKKIIEQGGLPVGIGN